ncbi:MAG: amidohydrolase family protein [Chitinivibrionales bacterium]|nr:amidohydrolase family protein [Chitinivibrionales bacterium]
MVVDFHAHYFPDDIAGQALQTLSESTPGMRAYTDGTLRGLLAAMDQAGIDRAVNLPVATKPSQVPSINRAAVTSRSPRVIHFGALHPRAQNLADDIRYLHDHGIRGVKLHPEYQDFYVDSPQMDECYGLLQDFGLIVVFHAGWDPGPFTRDHARPSALRTVHQRFPDLQMVAAHMGGLRMWDEVERELVGTGVYFDTSAAAEYMAPERFVSMVRTHGVQRVLFGTDTPWFDAAAARRWLERLPLTAEEREALLGKNAQVLAGIPT